MKRSARVLPLVAAAIVLTVILPVQWGSLLRVGTPQLKVGPVAVQPAHISDISSPLSALRTQGADQAEAECVESRAGCGVSPADQDEEEEESAEGEHFADGSTVKAAGAAVEQTNPGTRAPAVMLASFDGLGQGFTGPQGVSNARNPSDNSLAVGRDHILQIVNSRLAIFTKKGALYDTTGRVLYGAVPTNTIFAGFGGRCELRNNGDAVARYDQLADRWLIVMPIFRRDSADKETPYSMCYAVSTTPDPLGSYNRYEFKRKLFPDYPRPAIWPDGYYNPSSTGDEVIQKHACVVERAKMLVGQPAREQCIIIDGVNFLNNADIDGLGLPPAGSPNIMMAAGGTQLHKILEDDGIFVWKFHVDWDSPENTGVSGPAKIAVAPYHYLCDGQLTSCVPQPDTTRRLDSQGDKLMQRLVYRNVHGHEAIFALHSVNTSASAGGVRWYEFRLDEKRDPILFQQGTYAPDSFYRWMGSGGIDREGGIGIGYSFGGTPNYAGQRFAGRLAEDPPGTLSLRETVMVNGEAAQGNTLRWEDYATMAMDPVDDCTFWYVGDYLKKGATGYSSRIGGFRLPGCIRGSVSGSAFFDINHDGHHDIGEPGIAGVQIDYAGGQSGKATTDGSGIFSVSLPADPAYGSTDYTFTNRQSALPGWSITGDTAGRLTRGGVTRDGRGYSVHLRHMDYLTGIDFPSVCVVTNRGGADAKFWAGAKGKALLAGHESAWRMLVDSTLHPTNADGSRFTLTGAFPEAFGQFQTWAQRSTASTQMVLTAMNVAFGAQDGKNAILDPVANDWQTVNSLVGRVNANLSSSDTTAYRGVLEKLNGNSAIVTPATPDQCAKSVPGKK